MGQKYGNLTKEKDKNLSIKALVFPFSEKDYPYRLLFFTNIAD